ncbi:PREDICTED: flocculation protein FLO11-like [Poecilia mexicana]|uniref:flocculation protein FLO11-like n=1 Tax=Poecilia mexicana TaxID=48701 RepID=UPI00072D939C|nr:PREDICTED: flocculation protein FLO11-like [Poecilia mexicana]
MNASPLNAELYSLSFWTFGLVSSNKLKMPSIYLFYLGLALTSVQMSTTQDSSSPEPIISTTAGPVDTSTSSMTTSITTETLKTPETNGSMNASDSNTNTTATPGDRNETQTSGGGVAYSTTPMKPSSMSTLTPTTKTFLSTKKITTGRPTTKTNPKNKGGSNETTGIIVVVVIALVIVVFAVACVVSRRRGRRYNVDFAASPDENVPLGTMDPEVRAESAPQNGLKTFNSTEAAATEPKGPEAAPETQEEKKEEAAISAAAPSAEAAAPPEAAAAPAPEAPPAAPPEAPAAAPSPDTSEEKPKADDAKQSSSAPVDPPAEEKTDDEGAVSNKTSVESLKETNENNSNNSGRSQRRDWQRSNTIWEVGVDCPV